MKTKILLFAALCSFTFFIACDTNEAVSSELKAITPEEAITDSEIDATTDDIAIIAEDQFAIQQGAAAKMSTPIKSVLPPCAIITTVLTNDTWTRTIDFGTQGCTLHNGNVVKGKIVISSSKNFSTPIRTITYSLIGFYHNGKLIEGTKTITHELKSTELAPNLHPVTTHSMDLKITFSDGKVYKRIGTRVREMVAGFTTLDNWEDNVFLVWGYNITTFPNGNKYTSTITTPLRFVLSCKMRFPVRGVITIVKNDHTAVLDFGNGDCDDLATITVNGITKEIHLKR